MADNLVDDINALLEIQKGDLKILEQIRRAAINNEVISNYERGYVRGLAEKYLGRKIIDEKKNNIQTDNLTERQPIKSQIPSVVYESQKLNPKNKIYIGIGIAVLAVVVLAGVGLSQIPFDSIPNSPSEISTSNSNLGTDLTSYNVGDIISISGNSDKSLGDKVSLLIKNPNGVIVWSETVSLKSSGKFSTLAIAGGPNWDSGKYTLESLHGNKKTTITFQFAN